MLRTMVAATAAICTIGLIGAPVASAGPKFCGNHGTGNGKIYKTACGAGDGGAGPMTAYKDTDGKWRFMRQKDFDKLAAEKRHHQQ